MLVPKCALVIENNPEDLFAASAAVRGGGIRSIVSYDSSVRAIQFLQKCLAGERAVPDLLVVDLDLGQESGYEILRYRRSTRSLANIPLIVWTVLGWNHEQLCEVFNVDRFVSKSEGKEGLENAVKDVLSCLSRSVPGLA